MDSCQPDHARPCLGALAGRCALVLLLALQTGPITAAGATGMPAESASSATLESTTGRASGSVSTSVTRHGSSRIAMQPGRVVGIVDGDTLDLLTPERRRIRIRLSGIDAPERGQAFGQVARERLAERVFDRDVRIEILKSDRWGRSVGRVLDAEGDVNLAMIEGGWAWHFERYAREQPAAERRAYAVAQRRARERGDGLWADPHATAPWDWRASHGRDAGKRP